MPLHRPRRIFRGSGPGLAGLAGVLLALAAGGIGGGVLLVRQPAPLFHLAHPPAGAVTAEPQEVAVVDGATLRLHDTVLQLHGVAAPSRGHSCPDGQGTRYDCGAAASAALAGLVRDRRVACLLRGHDESGLAQGVCEAGGTELNHALVASGWARADDPALGEAEAAARTGRLGLWRNGADPGF